MLSRSLFDCKSLLLNVMNKFRNLSVIVNCVTNSLIHSQSKSKSKSLSLQSLQSFQSFSLNVSQLAMSSVLITLINLRKGQKSLGSLFDAPQALIVSWLQGTDRQYQLLSCPGQLKRSSILLQVEIVIPKLLSEQVPAPLLENWTEAGL